MKNEIRLKDDTTAEAPKENGNGNPDFLTLAEEVRARSEKPKNTVISIPQKLAPAEFNVRFGESEI